MRFRGDRMNSKRIVVTAYGKDNIVEKISISLYNDNYEAEKNAENYCTTINNLELNENNWIYARLISDNTPYYIKEFIPHNFKLMILSLDDRALQKVIREVDSKVLAQALVQEDDSVREKVFKNVTKNACKILIDDINYYSPSLIKEINIAQKEILKVILELLRCGEIISPYFNEE